MFKKNDKMLLVARILIPIVSIIMAIGCLAVGIVFAIIEDWIFCFIAIFGPLFCLLDWFILHLLLTFFCDAKLIRNKLYDESNVNLEVFFKARSERSNSFEIKAKKEAINAELAHLQELVALGIITAEDYELRKNEIISGK